MSNYLRNCWYAAAHSDEVTREPLARMLIDEHLVLYRRLDNSVVLMSDTCPHRFAPMSEGKLIDDELRCPYHGLRFNGDGVCTDNPHDSLIPKKACLKSYPTLERYGYVWFWAGDPEALDESLLPHFDFLEDPDTYKVLTGYLHVEGNYQLISDNLLDLTHAPYLHPQFAMPGVTIEQQLAGTETKLVRTERSVSNHRLRSGLPPNQPTIDLFGFKNEPVETRNHMHWHPPATMNFDNGTWIDGTPQEEGLSLPQAHVVTPETETSCHYFFSAGRNMLCDDEDVDQQLVSLLYSAFKDQDEPMIKMIQERMGPTGDLNSLNPVLLNTDAPAVAARRMLDKLIKDEQAG